MNAPGYDPHYHFQLAVDAGIEIFLRYSRQETMTAYSPTRTLLFVHGATYPAHTSFDLPLGGRIEGPLYEPDGSTPLTHTWAHVEAQTTNEESQGVGGNNVDEDNGTYSFASPPGEVPASPPDLSPKPGLGHARGRKKAPPGRYPGPP